MKHIKTLIVEDDRDLADSCKRLLKKANITSVVARTGNEALQIFKVDKDIDIVLSDLKMPEMDGIELLKRLKKINPAVEVIIMTGYGTIQNAVRAIKLGASNYITKPFNKEELINAIEKIVEKNSLKNQVLSLRSELDQMQGFENLIGNSKEMNAVYEGIKAAARNNSTVLIVGESGTGKELVARAIHSNSPKSKGPFVPVNCGAIPKDLIESEFFGHKKGAFTTADYTTEGLFRKAEKGTIFLDEIGEMHKDTQVKLLRVLQDKKVRPVGGTEEYPLDVKVIAATNRALSDLTEKHLLREDLFYRISVITITTPPLRDHPEDIPLLVKRYINKFNAHFSMNAQGMDRKALDILMDYHWPGNVRELENLMEGLFAMGINDSITISDLPNKFINPTKSASSSADRVSRQEETKVSSLKETERNLVKQALIESKGNKSKAAQKLGISRTRLYKKLDQYGLKDI